VTFSWKITILHLISLNGKVIAGTVSYLHMHALVVLYGQLGWVAALTSLSVDGLIVAASMTLLAESRKGARGGVLPGMLLVVGSVAYGLRLAAPVSQFRSLVACGHR
jgi:hypothetical protein